MGNRREKEKRKMVRLRGKDRMIKRELRDRKQKI